MKVVKKLFWTLALLGFAGYFVHELYQRSEDKKEVAEETLEQSISTVSTIKPLPADQAESITLPGNVQAWFQAPIYAQVSGYVKAWHKDYGAEVKKGDVLADIDTPVLYAQYEQAKADMAADKAKYDLAELTAHRFAAMRTSSAVPEQTIAVKEADARVAKAEYLAAQQNVANFEALMKFRTIVAPYDGVVVNRAINVGDYVNKEGNLGENGGAGSLFTVADIHKLRLFVSVPESFGAFLKPGLTAEVTVPQFADRKFTATFLTVAKGFDPNTRTAITVFTIENEDRTLWPGSYATVVLKVKRKIQHLVVPATALVFQEDGTQLAILGKDGKVHFKDIVVSQIRDSTMDVSKGLSLDDVVIDNPSAAFLEGDEVRRVTPAPGYKLTEAKAPEVHDKKVH